MKRMDIFCASQASTAICLTMEQPSSSSSASSSLLLGRAIDRYNPIIRDSRRTPRPLPCAASEPPISPKPIKNQNKKKNHPLKENESLAKILNSTDKPVARKSWSCSGPGDFFSPPGSTRYLLSEKAVSNEDLMLSNPETCKSSRNPKTEELGSEKPESSSPNQVVVLKVSLHCRGCEKKMKKNISRMEGVTSFSIDFMAKKVTIVGNVTPLGVLSKLKNAQLWPPTAPSNTFSHSQYRLS